MTEIVAETQIFAKDLRSACVYLGRRAVYA